MMIMTTWQGVITIIMAMLGTMLTRFLPFLRLCVHLSVLQHFHDLSSRQSADAVSLLRAHGTAAARLSCLRVG